MPKQDFTPDFAQVTTWVFDLDNTLYPPHMRLFDQIEVRMTDWVMQALQVDRAHADHLRAYYWATYGTTLAGLMREHGVDPGPYLNEVHDIDFSVLSPDPDLARSIASLPGRKIIYTNACAPYAEKVLAARGLAGLFDAIYGVEHAEFHPKPDAHAFATVFAKDGLDPTRGAMFEDDSRNLAVPHALGMKTVHVAPRPEPADHIHHHTDDLAAFLARLVG
ncbi:pyrimidine 5'-nucleotidase [Tabrizicola sp.]|uniref:pyrimidine 5'-nucleotidase n=1 Tax=Tabrizicola sp. TaxID=2005166 RepID=UPI001A4BE10B|nr:pyrimidine 5'-nucleotidase [Tabrizicola sp.]MBL9075403.1 pyrimidine 5'-nucleotidase [Tabrizicola sp.]